MVEARGLSWRQAGLIRWLVPLLLELLWLSSAGAAAACSLDGIASLSVNGTVATLTSDTATAATISFWAPFSLLAAAPGDRLRLSENMANVSRSIPREAAALPFAWSFGDGTSLVGRQAEHRYRQPGRFKITVRYYWPADHQWVVFDSAEQRIVPRSDLLKTNFGFYAGQVVLTLLRGLIWLILAVVIGLIVLERLRPGHRRRPGH
jgi:hypothetical protein